MYLPQKMEFSITNQTFSIEPILTSLILVRRVLNCSFKSTPLFINTFSHSSIVMLFSDVDAYLIIWQSLYSPPKSLTDSILSYCQLLLLEPPPIVSNPIIFKNQKQTYYNQQSTISILLLWNSSSILRRLVLSTVANSIRFYKSWLVIPLYFSSNFSVETEDELDDENPNPPTLIPVDDDFSVKLLIFIIWGLREQSNMSTL